MVNTATILPFPYEKLRTYTASQAALMNRVVAAVGNDGYAGDLVDCAEATLEKLSSSAVEIRYESFLETEFSGFCEALSDHFLGCLVSLPQNSRRIVVELDRDWSGMMMDLMLGGDGVSRQKTGLFTFLEQTVIEFAILKVMKSLGDVSETIHPRLEKMIWDKKNISQLESPKEKVILLTFRIRMGKNDGFVRFCIPRTLLTDVFFANDESLEYNRPSRQKWKLLKNLKTVAWAEIGSVTLVPESLAALEADDIVFLDDALVDLVDKKIEGQICVRFGDGIGGGVMAEIVEMGRKLRVRLGEVYFE